MSYVPATPIQTDIPSLKTCSPTTSRSAPRSSCAQTARRARRSCWPSTSTRHPRQRDQVGRDRADRGHVPLHRRRRDRRRSRRPTTSKVRGHTLVWHQQTPAWVFNDAAGTADDRDRRRTRRCCWRGWRATSARSPAATPNDIYAWDVVNEVIDENQSDGLRRSTWYKITGLDYIRTAFRVAREVAPNAKLYINDYNTNMPAKRDKLFDLVSQLEGRGRADRRGRPPDARQRRLAVGRRDRRDDRQVHPARRASSRSPRWTSASTPTAASRTRPRPPTGWPGRPTGTRRCSTCTADAQGQLTSVTLWGLADDDTWLKTFPVTRKDAAAAVRRAAAGQAGVLGRSIGSASRPAGRPSASPSTSALPVTAAASGVRRPALGVADPPRRRVVGPPTGPVGAAGDVHRRRPVADRLPGRREDHQHRVRPRSTAGPCAGPSPTARRISQSWNGTYTQSGGERDRHQRVLERRDRARGIRHLRLPGQLERATNANRPRSPSTTPPAPSPDRRKGTFLSQYVTGVDAHPHVVWVRIALVLCGGRFCRSSGARGRRAGRGCPGSAAGVVAAGAANLDRHNANG